MARRRTRSRSARCWRSTRRSWRRGCRGGRRSWGRRICGRKWDRRSPCVPVSCVLICVRGLLECGEASSLLCLGAAKRETKAAIPRRTPKAPPRALVGEGKTMLHAMIMAGGGGTRFWPRSRQQRPKQFLTMAGDRTLLQMALDRVESLADPANTWVITGEAYRDETRRQLPALPTDNIIGEPC